MNSVLTLLIRFVVIGIGYAFAVLCSSAFLHLVTFPMLGFTASETSVIVSDSAVFSVPFIALFVAYFAFIPAMPAIVLGEVLGQRDWLFYALAGGIIGAIIGISNFTPGPPHPDGMSTSFLLALVGAGICGGGGYWVVAGRGAGKWRQPSRDITSPGP